VAAVPYGLAPNPKMAEPPDLSLHRIVATTHFDSGANLASNGR